MTADRTWDRGSSPYRRMLEAAQDRPVHTAAPEDHPGLAEAQELYIDTGGDPGAAAEKRRAVQAQQIRDIDHHRTVAAILAGELAQRELERDQARAENARLEGALTVAEAEVLDLRSARRQRLDRWAVRCMIAVTAMWWYFLYWVATGPVFPW